jgi:hypothetical protein
MTGPGRPPLYKADNAELARKFCLLGATNEDLAGLFDVAGRTIDNWLATIPEFAAAVQRGRDVADADVVQSLHSRATGYSCETEKIFHYRGDVMKVPHTVHYPPDTTACMFWLRNRRRRDWLEKAELRREEEVDEEAEAFDFARRLDAAGEAMRFVDRDAHKTEEK